MGKIQHRIASARAATNRTRKPVKAGIKGRSVDRVWLDEAEHHNPFSNLDSKTLARADALAAGLLRAYSTDLGTMERHQMMQELADEAKDLGLRGKFGLICNRTQCLQFGATWYNRGSYAFYCHACATMLNRENHRSAEEFLGAGQALCIQVTSEEEAANLHVMG